MQLETSCIRQLQNAKFLVVNADGFVNKYKARLVAKGYAQTYGIDYEETHNLITKLMTLRVIIAMVATKGWSLHQMDVNNVFLHGDL
jgi:hypothetical protein